MNEPVSPAALLPPVDALLRRPALAAASLEHGRAAVREAVRTALDGVRKATLTGGRLGIADREAAASLVEIEALAWLARQAMPPLRRVFNLTGTVLHTNLGRAPLALSAVAAMVQAAQACDVEYDLDDGGRGERDDHVAERLTRLTGAPASLIVNNNAAAVLLALNSIANRREVIVSRGELIEIGGAFRMPDVMVRAGCRLKEVGTTNRTHLSDYADAIGPRTGAIMKVHPSNYAISGFASAVDERELAKLAHEGGLPFIVDLGSGSLVDLTRFGLPPEPTVAHTVELGADLVTFSGDKLLGGPQAGLVVGTAPLVAKLKRNPLKRALRVDKLTLAALGATLQLYDDPERLAERLPTLRLLTRGEQTIRELAERLAGPVRDALGADIAVAVERGASQIGSGSLPIDRLESWTLAMRLVARKRGGERALAALARAFRELPIPVIGRIQDGALRFDLRCLEDEAAFLEQLSQLQPAAHR